MYGAIDGMENALLFTELSALLILTRSIWRHNDSLHHTIFTVNSLLKHQIVLKIRSQILRCSEEIEQCIKYGEDLSNIEIGIKF